MMVHIRGTYSPIAIFSLNADKISVLPLEDYQAGNLIIASIVLVQVFDKNKRINRSTPRLLPVHASAVLPAFVCLVLFHGYQ